MLSRRVFSTLSAGAALRPVFGKAKRPPNVVLVMTDDQGYGDLACHGNPVIRTPHLDRLHSESVRFTHLHVDPLCSPTRSALMTGRYSARTGVWATIMGRSLLRRDETTVADLFGAGGYRTSIFGKWHLGDNYPYRPFDRGFHESLVLGGGGVGQTPDFWGNDYFDDTYFRNGRPEAFRGYCTDVFFREALGFVERNRKQPFFLYLAPNAPHAPYRVADVYRNPYLAKGIPAQMAAFYGMISNLDENVGRLTRRLEQLGLAENTILLFLTDNGTAAGVAPAAAGGYAGFSAGMRAQKGSPYDGGHRVPCFVRWPAGGIGGGRDIAQLAAHFDLLPTLGDLCGLREARHLPFDGISLAPFLRGTAPRDRTLVVQVQQRRENNRWQMDQPKPWLQSAVLTDRWRLVNRDELYDVVVDPGQAREVARENRREVSRLRAAYEEWWQSVSSRFGEYNPITVGSLHENPSRLNCMDWHGDVVPWDQPLVKQLPEANGFWAIDVEREGQYEFTLRHQPDRIPLRAVTAEVLAGERRAGAPVPSGAGEVVLSIALARGQTQLQTWLRESTGVSRGAFFVDLRRR